MNTFDTAAANHQGWTHLAPEDVVTHVPAFLPSDCLVNIGTENNCPYCHWEWKINFKNIFPNIGPSLGWELQARFGLRQDWLGTETQSCCGKVWQACWGTFRHSWRATRSGSELHRCLGTLLEKVYQRLIINCWSIITDTAPVYCTAVGALRGGFRIKQKN